LAKKRNNNGRRVTEGVWEFGRGAPHIQIPDSKSRRKGKKEAEEGNNSAPLWQMQPGQKEDAQKNQEKRAD